MPSKIISPGINYIVVYAEKCFKSNIDYTEDDVRWIMNVFDELIDEYMKEISKMYMMLALTNLKSYCGYFCLVYNNKISRSVKERDYNMCKRLLLNPVFDEVMNNPHLNKIEQKELLDVLHLEVMNVNYTIKRMSMKNDSNIDIDELYIDSYNDLYNKIFVNKLNSCKSDFQEFILITEHNSKNRNSHAYTFKLVDILSQCVHDKFKYELSEGNIQNLKTRFNLEIKMVAYSMTN